MILVPLVSTASDPKVQDKNVPKKSSSEAKGASEPFVGPASEAKKLYKRYKRSFDKTIVAIACVKNPKCIEPEDEVLRYSKEALGILEKLDTLAAEGDVQANYYRGLIAFERMKYYDRQAEIVTHPDFILTNTVFRRYAKKQYLLAEKYFNVPAKIQNPSACEYLGNLYLTTIVGNPQQEKAAMYFYNAANAYIEQGNQIAGARMYNAMKDNLNPADPRIIQVYAKLHNKEPIANWRKLPSDLVQSAPKKAEQHWYAINRKVTVMNEKLETLIQLAKKLLLWLILPLVILISGFILGEQFEVGRLAAIASCEGSMNNSACIRSKGYLATAPYYPDLARRYFGGFARMIGGDLGASYWVEPALPVNLPKASDAPADEDAEEPEEKKPAPPNKK